MDEQQKELYELRHKVYMLTGWEPEPELEGIAVTGRSPLYTSDYILEKLPRLHRPKLLRLYKTDDAWIANYGSKNTPTGESDTPIKALLRRVRERGPKDLELMPDEIMEANGFNIQREKDWVRCANKQNALWHQALNEEEKLL